jgi:hypothetical protein
MKRMLFSKSINTETVIFKNSPLFEKANELEPLNRYKEEIYEEFSLLLYQEI